MPPSTAPPPEHVVALRRRLEIPAGCFVLLSVGRFSPEKNQADLLRAAAELKRNDLSFRLVLVGGRSRTRAASGPLAEIFR